MKNISLLLAIVVLGMTSCKKDLIEKAGPAPTSSVSKFSEIKASETFDWKTSKEYTLQVTGMNTIADANGTFKVTSLDGKIIFYQAAHKMNESFTSKFKVPSHIKDLTLSFGSIRKNVSTVNTNIQFNYLPENSVE